MHPINSKQMYTHIERGKNSTGYRNWWLHNIASVLHTVIAYVYDDFISTLLYYKFALCNNLLKPCSFVVHQRFVQLMEPSSPMTSKEDFSSPSSMSKFSHDSSLTSVTAAMQSFNLDVHFGDNDD